MVPILKEILLPEAHHQVYTQRNSKAMEHSIANRSQWRAIVRGGLRSEKPARFLFPL